MFKQRLGDHNRNKIIAIVAVFLFAAAASPASAGTLTPLSYTVSLSAFSNCETGSGGTCTALTNLANYTDTYPANPPFVNGSEATNSSQAVVSGAPCPGEGPCSPKDPTVSASARAGSGGTANANISYSYSFEAMGPGPSVIVDVAGYLLVGGTGDGGAWNSSASIMAYDSSGVKVGGLYLANPQDENPPPL